jgi:hypothetical protein
MHSVSSRKIQWREICSLYYNKIEDIEVNALISNFFPAPNKEYVLRPLMLS